MFVKVGNQVPVILRRHHQWIAAINDNGLGMGKTLKKPVDIFQLYLVVIVFRDTGA